MANFAPLLLRRGLLRLQNKFSIDHHFYQQQLTRRLLTTTTFKTTMASPPKQTKLAKYIGTHNGVFHCDDVTACFMLKTLPRFKDHEIVRTRDPELLAEAEIVVDVGGVLDIDALRLDHHQRSFNQTIKDYHPNLRTTNPDKPVKLSSAGLVYAVFGKDIISEILGLKKPYAQLDDANKKMIDAVYEKVYVEFIEEIDGIDNGFETVVGDNLVYNYHISSHISVRVGRLNPRGKDASPELRLQHFHNAMKLVEAEIVEGIQFLGTVWWQMRETFRQDLLDRHQIDPSGQIVHLKGDLTSWKSSIIELEQELGIVGEIKFVVYFENDQWRATTVPMTLKSFASRVPLKEEWRGKRDQDLADASGVKDATFVHASGFTGGAKSLEGVMSLVRQSLALII